MCGVAGYTHFDRWELKSPIQRAIAALRHRGPDQHGFFESEHVSLGAVRLKIIDLAGGDQPMCTEDGDVAIAFNGEIYNYLEVREDLESRGHRFRSHCDTEVVLRAFVEWDVDCFARLRGMFAIALWIESERRLVLARDRLGIKPLYYACRNGNIYFGSELKALFEFPGISRRLSATALGYYLALNYVPGPLTLIEGVGKLPPGAWLDCRSGTTRTGVFWRNSFHPDHTISQPEAVEELDRLLRDSVREHLISDVPIGVWLSGGLDSSTVLHYAAEVSTSPIQTFSIGFPGYGFDESTHSRALASYYGCRHHEFHLHGDLDLDGAIHDMAHYSDEPGADAGALPVWFLSRLTRQHAVVALSGEGSDELFGGYKTYVADQYARMARRLPAPLLRVALGFAAKLPVTDAKIGLEYKLKRFLTGCLLPSDEAHFFWNGAFSREQRSHLGYEEDGHSPAALCGRLPGIPSPHRLDRYLCVDQNYYLPDDILYKCDRISMAHSLEVRPPFLDHRIVEFAARLPISFKVKGRSTKRLIRMLMRDKLPAPVLRRPKEGFDIPAHEWLRGPLRPLLLGTLNEHTVRRVGIFSPPAITGLVRQHLSRRANLGYQLWGLLTLHLWATRWNVEPCQAGEDSRTVSEVLAGA